MARFELKRWNPDAAQTLTQRRAGSWLRIAVDATTAAARNLAPVRTGRLQRSIAARPVERLGGGLKAGVRASAPYALWVEIGTRHTRPRPYLRPALGTVLALGGLLIERARGEHPEDGR